MYRNHTRRPIAVMAITSLLVLSNGLRQSQAATELPNIVMIISDDQTYSDFGFMGNARVHTPNLDDLASRSARFTHGYVPTSVCRPSLVTLLTGRYPHQHGVHFNHPPPGFSKLTKTPSIDKTTYDAYRSAGAALIRDQPTLPRLLAAAGYRCLQTGKFWEGHYRNAGFTHGMTTSEPSGGKYGDKTLAGGDVVAHGNGDHGLAIGRQTMQPIEDFLDRHDEHPFLIWYAPFLPHTPHDSPSKYVELARRKAGVAEHEVPYYASIAQFDDTVGQLIRSIRDRGTSRDTLFVFVVDNGWQPDPGRFFANRKEWDHTKRSKRAPFDAGLRTPILFCWEGRIVPQSRSRPVSSVEIVPTLLDAAGVPMTSLGLPTAGLLPELLGEKPGDKTSPVFGSIYPGDASVIGNPSRDVAYRWVRQERYKLIVPHLRDGKPAWNNYLSEPALYDIINDPDESDNLIAQEQLAGTVNALRRALNDWWTP